MLMVMSVAGGLDITGDMTAQADAAAPLSCAADQYYAVQNNGVIRHVDASTTPSTATSVPGGWTTQNAGATINANVNGIAVTAGGLKAYAFVRNLSPADTRIVYYDTASGTWGNYGPNFDTGLGGSLIAGAVNLADGNYYFGGYNSSGQLKLWRFNTTTNTVDPSYVLTVNRTNGLTGGGLNGDAAFDGNGSLYFVSDPNTDGLTDAQLWSLPASSVQAGGTQTAQQIGATFNASGSVNGIALTSDGNLAITMGTKVEKRNIADGTSMGTIISSAGSNIVDLASCTSPSTLTLRKNVVQRIDPADQFVLRTAKGASTLATATTDGPATGTQTKQAGPAPVSPGDTYTISEVMASGSPTTSIAEYTSSWSCTVGNTTIASGSGPSGSVTIPAGGGHQVDCVITNEGTPLQPALELIKTVDPSVIYAPGEQVTYTYAVTNKGNVAVHGLGIVEDVFDGGGTLATPSCAATTLGVGATTHCTVTYTSVAGDFSPADVINNTAHAHGLDPRNNSVDSNQDSAEVDVAKLTLAKSASPAEYSNAGETITYSFSVTNAGTVTVSDLEIIEDTGAFTGSGSLSTIVCPVTTLAPGGTTTCTATYVVTQDDVDQGSIENVASAAGVNPDDVDPVSGDPHGTCQGG